MTETLQIVNQYGLVCVVEGGAPRVPRGVSPGLLNVDRGCSSSWGCPWRFMVTTQ
ncbi:hypothetical protein BaRGS_00022576, partial [Batillaria attramentaria]